VAEAGNPLVVLGKLVDSKIPPFSVSRPARRRPDSVLNYRRLAWLPVRVSHKQRTLLHAERCIRNIRTARIIANATAFLPHKVRLNHTGEQATEMPSAKMVLTILLFASMVSACIVLAPPIDGQSTAAQVRPGVC
jgi:hypothetical protein